jgi:FG-GAP-like repeat
LWTQTGVTLWSPGTVIPVCWLETGFDTEKAAIRESIHSTWEAYANISFGGFSLCSQAPFSFTGYIRVHVDLASDACGGGSAILGRAGLQSATQPTGQSVSISVPRPGCTDTQRLHYLAVHEFGHVLGFSHEQDRDGSCGGGVYPPGTNYTVVDPSSVMHYCSGNTGKLSRLDQAGVVIAYGAPLGESVLWHNGISGVSQIWYMSGASRTNFASLDASLNNADASNWRPVALSDRNLDGHRELLWHNSSTGASQFWYMNGAYRERFADLPGLDVPESTGWKIAGIADFNGDGKTDILWHDSVSGVTQIWYMNGGTRAGFSNLDSGLNNPDSSGWKIAIVRDFNQDGIPDLFWHHGPSGANQIWYMAAGGTRRTGFANLDTGLNVPDSTNWRLVGSNDLNRDGRPELLWHQAVTGETQVWYMNASGTTRASFQSLDPGLNVADATGWRIVSR